MRYLLKLFVRLFVFLFIIHCNQLPTDPKLPTNPNSAYDKFTGNRMLMISIPQYKATLDEFIDFKKQQGFDVMLNLECAAGGVDSIKGAIKGAHQLKKLTYIILIGDIEDVPSPYYLNAPSDPSYVLLDGNDLIGDALISRISIKNEIELKNILNKIILFEKGAFNNHAWISKAIVVGIREFDGLNHTVGIVQSMRDKKAYFRQVFQILDSDADASGTFLRTFEKEGANMIVYNSHGAPDGFHSIPFRNADLAKLSNFGSSLSFIHGAGCSTGSFQWSEGDCFAEKVLKTGTIEKPAGPVGILAFSRSANPYPAMAAQRKAFMELYFLDEIDTIGELCYYSNLYAMQQVDPYEAEKFYNHWHLFGDCSMKIRKQQK